MSPWEAVVVVGLMAFVGPPCFDWWLRQFRWWRNRIG